MNDAIRERVQRLLTDIDAEQEPQASQARLEIKRIGVVALDPVLQSVGDINDALLRQERMDLNMERLRLRVEILGAIKDERAVMPVIRAVVDSSVAIQVLNGQRVEIQSEIDNVCQSLGMLGLPAGVRPDLVEASQFVRYRSAIAYQLMKTGVNVLAGFGELSLPHIERGLPKAPPCAQRPLNAARARILKQWWKFWLWI